MDKVLCPYCGAEMEYRPQDKLAIASDKTHTYELFRGRYQCVPCAVTSPYGRWEITKTAAREPAYAAAMQRYEPPNRVLTLDEVRDRGGCPVWCEDRDGSGDWALVTAWDDKCIDANFGDWEFYCYGWTNERGWRAWTSKPTDDEREAEKWEDAE